MKMRMLCAAVCWVVSGGAFAEVPQQINHQGVVKVNGQPFTGTGKFKFAILNASGVNVWTNDGTNLVLNGVPSTFEDVTVTDGVYSVVLGGTSPDYTMTPIVHTVFNESDRRLRIWFNDAINGVQQLAPDHALTSTPYANQSPHVFVNESGTNFRIGTARFNDLTPAATGMIASDGQNLELYPGHDNVGVVRVRDLGSPASLQFNVGPNGWNGEMWAHINAFSDITNGTPTTLNIAENGGRVALGLHEAPQDTLHVGGNIRTNNNIIASGNVGIGANPTSDKLSVFGNIFTSGSISASGNISAVGMCCSSDLRFKRDITPIGSAIAKILSIRGVNYHWRAEEFPERQFNDRLQVGFVAQELGEVLPEAVVELKDGTMAVDYDRVAPLLVEGVKDLHMVIEEQRCEIDALRDELKELRRAVLERGGVSGN